MKSRYKLLALFLIIYLGQAKCLYAQIHVYHESCLAPKNDLSLKIKHGIDSLLNNNYKTNWDTKDYNLWGNSLLSDLSFALQTARDYPNVYTISTLGIIALEENKKYKVTIGITANMDSVNNTILAVFNLIAIFDNINEKIVFKNYQNEVMKNWFSFKVGNILFYKEKENQVNKLEANEMNSFNDSMAKIFNTTPIKNIVYFSCKDPFQLYNLKGMDYISNAFYSSSGGLAIRGGKNSIFDYIIYSGNNRDKYVHEIVHFYCDNEIKNDTNTTAFANEGIATFFGGSSEKSLEYHLGILKNHLKNDSSLSFEKLFSNNPHTIEGSVATNYSVGGLFAKLIYKRKQIKGLITFLNTNEKDLKKVVADLLNVNEHELEELFYHELEKY